MKLDFGNGLKVVFGVMIATVLHGCNDIANSESGADAKLTVSIPYASSNRTARTTTDAVIAPAYIRTYTITVLDSANNVIVSSWEIPARGGELSLTVPPNTALQVTGEALDQGHAVRFRGSKAVPPIAAGVTASVSLTLDALTPLSSLVQASELGTLTVPDGTTDVVVIATNKKADQNVTYEISGGVDQNLFNIDINSGQLSFRTAPSSQNPNDANQDNVYEVQVTFTDGFESVIQELKVVVGYLDISFGTNGIVTKDFGDIEFFSSDSAKAVVVQSGGKIVVVGTTTNGSALVRYTKEGILDDLTFGTKGIVLLSGTIAAMALQSDDSIVVAGTILNTAGNTDFLLMHFDKDGNIDTGFGGIEGGIVKTDIDSGSNDGAAALVIQADGKIVVVGYMDNPAPTVLATGRNFAMVRYERNGTRDATFGPNNADPVSTGIVVTSIPGYMYSEATAVTLQNDTQAVSGKIVVAGYANSPSIGNDFVVVRYTNDGMRDSSSFNPTGANPGIVITDFASTDLVPTDDRATGVVIQPDGTPDGKIIAVGNSSSSGTALVRYKNDGTVDTDFGPKGFFGKVTNEDNFYDNRVALKSDGKRVVAGNNDGSTGLVQFNSDGTTDLSFGKNGNGMVNGPISQFDAVALQPNDGKIIVVGTSNTNSDFAVVRFNP